MRISDWSSDVCSSDLPSCPRPHPRALDQRDDFGVVGCAMIGRDAAKAGGTADLIGPFVELQARLARIIGGTADINLAHPEHLLGFGADGGFLGRLVPPTAIAYAHGQITTAPHFTPHRPAF